MATHPRACSTAFERVRAYPQPCPIPSSRVLVALSAMAIPALKWRARQLVDRPPKADLSRPSHRSL